MANAIIPEENYCLSCGSILEVERSTTRYCDRKCYDSADALRLSKEKGVVLEVTAEDDHCTGIPFDKVVEALRFMEYASEVRVMFGMLFLTGCRISELSNMKPEFLFGNILYWGLGKNQKGYRKERLPEFYLRELDEYRRTNRIPAGFLFGIDGNTLNRYFTRDVRPKLGKDWQRRRFKPRGNEFGKGYVYQLKGLRKTFQTLYFADQLKKWKSSEVALEMTSKKMRHSSRRVTAYHYLCEFDNLKIDRFRGTQPAYLLQNEGQTRLMDFGLVRLFEFTQKKRNRG